MADMVSRKWGAVLDCIRSLAAAPGGSDGDDSALVDRVAADGDHAAFTLLFERHGPLVWAVCRRVLGQTPDAEDALQATFLVLLRRARAISKRTSVRSWLYGVAHRIAVRARAGGRRRHLPSTVSPVPDPSQDAALREVRAVLDEEVSRLPERLRIAIILCYFEGRTNDEAAGLLGCTRGTIASNLARARERLRSRLARRGVTLAAGAFAAMLSQEAGLAAPAVPSLAPPTGGATSPRVTDLAEGVIRTMYLSNLNVTGLCLAVLLAIASVLTAAFPASDDRVPQAGDNPKSNPRRPVGAPASDDPLESARKASMEAAMIQSAVGTAIFEQYFQERGEKEPTLSTRAKVCLSFDQGKYLLHFAFEKKLQKTLFDDSGAKKTTAKLVDWRPRDFVILYDGRDAYSITFADGISPAGCMMEIYSGLPVPEFPWKDPARLGTQVLNIDGLLKNVGRDAIKMAKLPDGGYRGVYHLPNGAKVRCEFDVVPDVGFNVTALKVFNEGDDTPVQSGAATWKKINGRWYVERLVDEFDNRHLNPNGRLVRSVLRYETFEPGAAVDAKQFSLESLPIPEKVYRLDRRTEP
jgi:RNA polymerase sigma factor (sigma-70 family)